MPTLDWIGKKAVVKYHKDVPYRLLEPVPELSHGDQDSGNLIVQGDNLHALKALLPRYAGQVKCIYIDPPYNTGNEGWVYNDNVNSPEIRKWLGDVVGKEAEDLSRHDKWLCKNLPDATLTHESKRAFVAAWINKLLSQDDMDLGKVNQRKFEIRNLLEARIKTLRKQAATEAYRESLFGDGAEERVSVSDEYVFTFEPYAYAPSHDYADEYGPYDFRHHYYSRIGNFDSREEFECAVWLDQQADSGRIEFWVRNLVRREGSSFSLQKADGKFYPDFICMLPGGEVLVVEYKGGDRWDTPKVKMDRMVGELWANMSNERCRFVMVKDKDWSMVDSAL